MNSPITEISIQKRLCRQSLVIHNLKTPMTAVTTIMTTASRAYGFFAGFLSFFCSTRILRCVSALMMTTRISPANKEPAADRWAYLVKPGRLNTNSAVPKIIAAEVSANQNQSQTVHLPTSKVPGLKIAANPTARTAAMSNAQTLLDTTFLIVSMSTSLDPLQLLSMPVGTNAMMKAAAPVKFSRMSSVVVSP